MDITRRIFVSGAMAVPFLGKLGTADAVPNRSVLNPTFTVLSGLTELRLSDYAVTQLAKVGIIVYAIHPGEEIPGADGTSVVGVKLGMEHGRVSIEPSGRPAAAAGRVLGGVGLRTDSASMEIVGIRADIVDGRVFAFLKVNDEWRGELPVYRINVDEVRLVTEVGLPSQPTRIKAANIPLRPAQGGLDAFTTAFGSPVFAPDDVVVLGRGEGVCWPLPPS